MRICHISDTHSQHDLITHKINQLKADCIIHSGDISMVGDYKEVTNFIEWFESLEIKYKIFILGNHDKSFDPKFWYGRGLSDDRWSVDEDAPNWTKQILEVYQSKPHQYFLHDSSVVIEGIKFFGSPYSRWFHGDYWAFNLKPEDAYQHHQKIPKDTDVVITHGPCLGKLDYTKSRTYAGDEQLRDRLEEIKPKYHLCGHIHEAHGQTFTEDTTYLNSSIMDIHYEPVNIPQTFEL